MHGSETLSSLPLHNRRRRRRRDKKKQLVRKYYQSWQNENVTRHKTAHLIDCHFFHGEDVPDNTSHCAKLLRYLQHSSGRREVGIVISQKPFNRLRKVRQRQRERERQDDRQKPPAEGGSHPDFF